MTSFSVNVSSCGSLPGVFCVCSVTTLGHQFTLSVHALKHLVGAFAGKCVCIPCAAGFQRNTWTKRN